MQNKSIISNINYQYVLDANIFIEASRRYYAFDFGTKFWDFLLQKAIDGKVCSIDKVLEEIKQGKKDDPLKIWATQKFAHYFFTTKKDEILQHYKQIANLVFNNNQYTDAAKNEFLQENNADAWIIAYAKCYNLTVVTHEAFNPNSKKIVPIPNVCENFNIQFINIFELLKQLNFQL